MLRYVARLHARSTHPARPPFPFDWEEIGPGYCYAPAFGHWDIVHQALDVLPFEPEHARRQILNDLASQQPDGLVPGSIWMKSDPPRFSTACGHPPVWPAAVDAICEAAGSHDFAAGLLEPLERQIRFFETRRRCPDGGFFYLDVLGQGWESGVDQGVRFREKATEPYACVDASCHVFAMYEAACRWAPTGSDRSLEYASRAEDLLSFIQQQMFDAQTGIFCDRLLAGEALARPLSFEGMWPVAVGAATDEQAQRVIDENLLAPERFFTPHSISSVAASDPDFELRLWNGPAWNSTTYWAARGCLKYGRPDAARLLLEAALDSSARVFGDTGTIWEFYHPFGGSPNELGRKPETPYDSPCPDYLGHNPLIAMAGLWAQARAHDGV